MTPIPPIGPIDCDMPPRSPFCSLRRPRLPIDRLERRRHFAFTPYGGKLVEQTVFDDLTLPMSVEFAADGRIFVSEKAGLVKTYDSASDSTGTVVLDLSSQVNSAADRGLLGMALSPTFSSDHYVYLLYTFDGNVADNAARTTNTDLATTTVSGKLVRYTYSNGSLTGEHLLVHDWPQQYSSHSIGHIAFGPDGYLYASGGDGASFNNVDYGQYGNPFNDPANEGGALRSQDVLSDGDAAGLDGTIIRIDPSSGAGVSGNPFFASGDANKRRIVAYGLRNPYRFTWRPGTSELWIGDVGWTLYEEINRLTSFGTNNAPNFQWPAFEGPGWQGGYKGANLPLLQGLYNNSVPGSTAPYYTYAHSDRVDVTNNAEEPVGGSSITGLVFHDGGTYPYPFSEGTFFFSDYARQTIYSMALGSDGLPDTSTATLMQSGVFAVEMTLGPDGNVWYVDIAAGKVVRLTGKGPTAQITANTTSGSAPLTVSLSAANSYDPDVGDVLSYAWDLDNDGQFDDATGMNATKVFGSNGTYTVRMRATDYGGLTDTASLTIRVGSSAPVPTITTPTLGTKWKVGQTFNFSGSATDAEDGTLAASRLSWRVVLRHANEDNPNTAAHDHILATFNGVSSGSFTTIDHDYPSWLELRLTATDSDGNAVTTTRRLDPQTLTVNVGSTSPGVRVAFNDRVLTTPFSRTVILGSTNSISVTERQVVAGYEWRFDGWQDGGKPDPFGVREWTAPKSGDRAALFINGHSLGWKLLDGVPIAGNAPAGSGNTRDRAFDGDDGTGYRSASTGGAIGIDFGSATRVNQIVYTMLGGGGVTMVGGRFQGSNKSNFADAKTLYTFDEDPTPGLRTGVTSADGLAAGTYRYLRYLAPGGSVVSLAELAAYAAVDAVDYRGKAFGSSAKSNSSLANAFDGRQSTSYTASKDSGAWVALDLGEPRYFDTLRFAPDLGAPSTMRGGTFQAANKADFSDARNLYTVESTPPNGMHEVWPTTGGQAWRYVRYVGRNGQASRIAEFHVLALRTPQVPAGPSGLSVLTQDTASGVTLAWRDESIIETGFRVRRSENKGKTWKTIANLGVNATGFADTQVAANKTYTYRVIALNTFGYGGESTLTATVAAGANKPAAPSAPTLTKTNGVVSVAWADRSNNETAFRIERRYTNYIWGSVGTVGPNVTSFLDESAIGGVAYEYRIVALNGAGETIGDGATIVT